MRHTHIIAIISGVWKLKYLQIYVIQLTYDSLITSLVL